MPNSGIYKNKSSIQNESIEIMTDIYKQLNTNQKILVEALIQRGASIQLKNMGKKLIQVDYKGKTSFLENCFNEKVPYNWIILSSSKIFMKNFLLEKGISVPSGNVFCGAKIDNIQEYTSALGYPLVFKPDSSSSGDHVYVDVRTPEELLEISNQFITRHGDTAEFIIEKYFTGTEYRIFITQNGEFAILEKKPAQVIGDGIQTIEEIINAENEFRINLRRTTNTSICPIVIDNHVYTHLSQQKLSLSCVPLKGQKIFLRADSDIDKGGTSCNVTAIAHPSVKEIALKIIQMIPMPFIGIDFITFDITQPQTKESYCITNINSSPEFSLHLLPMSGAPVNVGEYAVNILFDDEIHSFLHDEIVDNKYTYNRNGMIRDNIYRIKSSAEPNTEAKLVIKFLPRHASERKRRHFAQEVFQTIELQKYNQGIMQIIDYDKNPEPIWYIMPEVTDIYQYLEQSHSLEQRINCILETAKTLCTLHAKKIAHRDIKPSNIFFNGKHFLLGDFELVYNATSKNTGQAEESLGSTSTIAPEMKNDATHADPYKADVYSLAKTLWIVLSGDFRGFLGEYSSGNSAQIIKKMYDNKLIEPLEELLFLCTQNNPQSRPTINYFTEQLELWLQEYCNSMNSLI